MDIPITQAKLASLALAAAQSQLGQSEQPAGSNSGPMVNKYLAATGLKPGYAWCQAFIYWCYNDAAKQLNIQNPMVRTAGVQDCWNRSPKRSKLLKQEAVRQPELIRPGDQLILFYSGNTGHTGVVERVAMAGEVSQPDVNGNGRTSNSVVIHTIEGNSNNNGSREGIAVVRHERKLSDKALIGFIQYEQ